MKKELTTQELIKLSKEILEVKNRRERSLKLGEILKHETFRVYYKGDDDLFVVILPICALGNDGVVFRK